jgi:spore coat protein CotF
MTAHIKRKRPSLKGQMNGQLRNHELKELMIKEGWIKDASELRSNDSQQSNAEIDQGSESNTGD